MDPSAKYSGKNLATLMLANYLHQKNIPPVPEEFLRDEAQTPLITRAWTFDCYIRPLLDRYIDWLDRSRERTNFTYDLTELNELQLAGIVDAVTGCGLATARGYFEELKGDEQLKAHVARRTQESEFRDVSDAIQGYGRRIGWYAFVRAAKPRLVVETGVDKGLGSCVLTSALLKNRAEGFPGRYVGTDKNPKAGFLFTEPYTSAGTILYGDSIASLRGLADPIDLFINDSDHSASYEADEYRTVHKRLGYRSIILGDNAHATTSLFDYAAEHGKKFLFFAEQPKDHFYPGAGIGICY